MFHENKRNFNRFDGTGTSGTSGTCDNPSTTASTVRVVSRIDEAYQDGRWWWYMGLAYLFDERQPETYELVKTVGECSHYRYVIGNCGGACVPSEETCSANGECEPIPEPLYAGEMTIEMGGESLVFDWGASNGSYYAELPFIEANAEISVHAEGDEFPEFHIGSSGTTCLDQSLADRYFVFPHTDFTLEWKPDSKVDGQCVEFELWSANEGHGLPPNDFISCWSEDDGTLVVPGEILTSFGLWIEDPSGPGYDSPFTMLSRYQSSVFPDLDLELKVGSEALFFINE